MFLVSSLFFFVWFPCGRLSWLHVSFWAHVNIVYHIISYHIIIWVQDGNCEKMTRDNFSIGAFYNITKTQDNPIKTVGRDSFLSPKTPKNTSFLGVTQPPGVAQRPYILGDTTRPRHITCVRVWSKSDQRRLRKTLHKETDRQTNRHYENNGHLAVNQLLPVVEIVRKKLRKFCQKGSYGIGLGHLLVIVRNRKAEV